jgi:hypothetical protein
MNWINQLRFASAQPRVAVQSRVLIGQLVEAGQERPSLG